MAIRKYIFQKIEERKQQFQTERNIDLIHKSAKAFYNPSDSSSHSESNEYVTEFSTSLSSRVVL